MSLPQTIKVEVKFTTSPVVQISLRELEALRTTSSSTIGLLATLFWTGDYTTDGRWLIMDMNDALGSQTSCSLSITRDDLLRASMTQIWLTALRDQLEQGWRPLLQGFLPEALSSHSLLLEVLERSHRDGTLRQRLPEHQVLEAEHRQNILALLDTHSQAGAGRLFQDLLAYLLGLVGYRTVLINPVGVPDVTVTDPVTVQPDETQPTEQRSSAVPVQQAKQQPVEQVQPAEQRSLADEVQPEEQQQAEQRSPAVTPPQKPSPPRGEGADQLNDVFSPSTSAGDELPPETGNEVGSHAEKRYQPSRAAEVPFRPKTGDQSGIRSNREFQREILRWLKQEQGVVIVPTGRLARLLRHHFREDQLQSGHQAWNTPTILTLGGLLRSLWSSAWPESIEAPPLVRFRFWRQAIDRHPPPPGLTIDRTLLLLLDETYQLLVESHLPLQRADFPLPLIAWRGRVCRLFSQLLAAAGYFHPAHLPDKVCAGMARQQIVLRQKFLVAGFLAPAPAEEAFLTCLAARCSVRRLALPRGTPSRLRAVALPSFEQELLWLGEELIQAVQTTGRLSRVGLVLLDLERYQTPVRQLLSNLFGPAAYRATASDEMDDAQPFVGAASHAGSEQRAFFYNLALAEPLTEQPLVQAALLPLQLLLAPERELLLELLLSSYYGTWSETRSTLARADCLWRDQAHLHTLSDFLDAVEKNDAALALALQVQGQRLDTILAPLAATSPQSARAWVGQLTAIWQVLGFPLPASERDQVTLSNLHQVLARLSQQLIPLELSLSDFHQWLLLGLQLERTTESGEELAGIQIVGAAESRALDFDYLIVPGVTGWSLPQPPRRLPLLSVEELRVVPGGSAVRQHFFAQEVLGNLLAAAPTVVLCRPMMRDDEPIPLSFSWPAEQEERATVAFWSQPSSTWFRVPWVRRAWAGRTEGPPTRTERPLADLLPATIAASALGDLILCPFKFIIEHVIKVAPLPEPELGLDALQRGQLLHQILAHFTQQILTERLDLLAHRQQVDDLLGQVVRQCARRAAGAALLLSLEQERLLGGQDYPLTEGSSKRGLLWTWLEEERERWRAGWRFFAAERGFSGPLTEDLPFQVTGRIDRIDQHGEEGLFLWDYKTGQLPQVVEVLTDFIKPQLLAYLAAIQMGLVSGLEQGAKARAGYWGLRSEGELRQYLHQQTVQQWAESLDQFRTNLSANGRALTQDTSWDWPAQPDQLRKLQTKHCPSCAGRLFCPGQARAFRREVTA